MGVEQITPCDQPLGNENPAHSGITVPTHLPREDRIPHA